eukprot:jgi/Mesen1/4087/ME000214S03274
MVLVHSLRSTKTPYDVVVLTKNTSSSTRHIFRALGAKVDPAPSQVPLLAPALLSITNVTLSCFSLKFQLWSLTQYTKVLFLDHHMLALENMDEVFERPQLTAAPDNDLPDRFNPGLMLLEPSLDTYAKMLTAFSQLQTELPVGAEDLMFFNHFFSDWPRLGPAHHLDYGYNAISKLGYSATWNEWVHPKLKAVHFLGHFERWDDVVDKHYPPTRRYDHLRWEVLRDMYAFLVQQGVVLPSEGMANRLCQTDYMTFAQGAPVARKLSVVIQWHGHLLSLHTLIRQISSLRIVHKVYVMPRGAYESTASLPPTWNASKPVELLPPGNFTPSERMRPIESLETDCVLLWDDGVLASGPVLSTAFKLWTEHPHRLVGFMPSAHYRDAMTSELVYVPAARGAYSMVSARLLLLHGDYLQSYTCSLLPAVRDYVDKAPECADIALNLLAAQLSNTTPLLVLDTEKRVAEESSGLYLRKEELLKSVCLNDLEALMGGGGPLPLHNSTEAKVHLEHDVFTKIEFHDPHAVAEGRTVMAEELNFQPIYDANGKISGVADENFRFMSSVPRMSAMPEVIVLPSPLQSNRVLCMMGNTSSGACSSGGDCNNTFAIATYRSIPTNALMLMGTTLLLHSRYGFDDRFHTPNILANLFYPYPDYGFLKPARAFFFKRGSLDMRLSQWSRLLFKALLGDHIAPFRIRNGHVPVCFERAVMTRRYRPVPGERGIVLREVQERAWGYCNTLAANPVTGGMTRGMGFLTTNATILRVLLLHGDTDTGYGIIANLEELRQGLKAKCRRSKNCELLVVNEQNFTNFCQQVLHMGAATVFITPSGDGTMNHVIFMRPGSKVLELVPFGIPKYDPRVLKVYQEAAKWIGLEYASLAEPSGSPCPQKDPSCRFLYRKRPMIVDVDSVVQWLVNVKKNWASSLSAF